MKQKKIVIIIILTIFSTILFAGGTKESSEVITKTESGTAIFLNSATTNPSDDGSVGGTGDVQASSGWLYSDIITIYPEIDYRITATVVVGSASSNNSDAGGDRVRLYLVPITNTSNTFTLSDAGGIAVIKLNGENAVKQPYIELSTGTHTIDIIFSSNELTKMRVVFEKGQPDWSNADNAKMAGQEVRVSNIQIDYVIE